MNNKSLRNKRLMPFINQNKDLQTISIPLASDLNLVHPFLRVESENYAKKFPIFTIT